MSIYTYATSTLFVFACVDMCMYLPLIVNCAFMQIFSIAAVLRTDDLYGLKNLKKKFEQHDFK